MAELLEMTIGEMMELQARLHPDQDGLVSPLIGVRYSYKELNEMCDRVARGFMAMGIKKGDHIAMWSSNYPEWVITQFASAKMGAVLVTVNTNYKRFELEYLMRQSDSTTLITMHGTKDSDYLQYIYELCPELKTSEPGKLECEALPQAEKRHLSG